MPIHAGYAQETITPAPGSPAFLAGRRPAEYAHSDLTARALALVDGSTRLVLAAADLDGLPRAFCQAVERRVQAVYPGTQLVLAATHNPHSPNLVQAGADYQRWLEERTAAACAAALAGARGVRVRAATVEAPGLAVNTRGPAALDQELVGLQLVDFHNHPVCTLVNYACRPDVLGPACPHISADFTGPLRREIEAQTGGGAVFFAGALCGVIPNVPVHSFMQAEALGFALAHRVLEAVREAPFAPMVPLSYTRLPYEVPVGADGQPADPGEEAGTEAALICTEAGLVRVGPLWLLAAPGEVLPALGIHLKAMLCQAGARAAGVLGLANDALGPILPAERFADQPEPRSVGPQAGPRLLAAAARLLGE